MRLAGRNTWRGLGLFRRNALREGGEDQISSETIPRADISSVYPVSRL